MATEASESKRESMEESHRTSLLDIIEERFRTQNKKYLIHRLVYVSKIRSPQVDRTSLGNYYDQLMKKLQADYSTSEPISGLMLIYLKHIVHVVETSSDTILKIVKDLWKMEQEENSYISKSKILVVSHDVNIRLYSYWSFRTLDVIEHGIEAFDTNDSFENIIVDFLTQLLKLGVYLFKQPKLSLKSAMDSLHEKVPDFLPQQSIVHYLLEENDSSMITPEEFINMYEKPFDTSLESDSASLPFGFGDRSLSLHMDTSISAPVSSHRSHKENLITVHELRSTSEDPTISYLDTLSKLVTAIYLSLTPIHRHIAEQVRRSI